MMAKPSPTCKELLGLFQGLGVTIQDEALVLTLLGLQLFPQEAYHVLVPYAPVVLLLVFIYGFQELCVLRGLAIIIFLVLLVCSGSTSLLWCQRAYKITDTMLPIG